MSPTSEYLKRPLRSEEEARADLRKKCGLCKGSGHIRGRSLLTERAPLVPCPICNKEAGDV